MELSVTQREQAFSGSVAVRAVNRNLWLLVFGPWSLGDMSKRPYGMQGYLREINSDRFERMLRKVLGEDQWYLARHHDIHEGTQAVAKEDKDHDGKPDHPDYADEKLARMKKMRDPHRYYDALWSWLHMRNGEDAMVGDMPWERLDSIEICGFDCEDPEQLQEIMQWLEHFRESIPDVLIVHEHNVFEAMARSAHASLTSLGAIRSPFYDDWVDHMAGYIPLLKPKKPH